MRCGGSSYPPRARSLGLTVPLVFFFLFKRVPPSYFAVIGRKIGCDKSLPSCNNCARTGRKCMGYGVRLTWPDSHDGRRKLPILPARTDQGHHQSFTEQPPSPYYGQQFLNVSSDDVEKSRRDASALALTVLTYPHNNPRPKPSLTLLPGLRGKESDLMSYCKSWQGHDKCFYCFLIAVFAQTKPKSLA